MKLEYKKILTQATILLVEDDMIMRTIYKDSIAPYVDFIYEASNGNEALKIFKRHKPHLVITDMKMPLMDGLSFCVKLRKIDKNIPIIAISAYRESDTLVQLMPLKLVDYLVKPIYVEKLIDSLEKAAEEIKDKGYLQMTLFGKTIYSYSKKSLIKNKDIVPLTANEISFIELLLENKNRIVTIYEIENRVYGDKFVSNNAINTLASKLRKKMGANIIKSIPSHGYILDYRR